jgi:hypothetical protein
MTSMFHVAAFNSSAGDLGVPLECILPASLVRDTIRVLAWMHPSREALAGSLGHVRCVRDE